MALLSWFIELVIEDLLLFQSFVDLGGRISLLIYSSVPIIGSIFGPFLGITSSLLALRYIDVGISTTIAQLNIIFIIPFSVLFFKEKVNMLEIIAAIVAPGGTAILILL